MGKLIIDQDSGTVISMDNCSYIESDNLTDEQIAIIEDGSDSERINLGYEIGSNLTATLEVWLQAKGLKS